MHFEYFVHLEDSDIIILNNLVQYCCFPHSEEPVQHLDFVHVEESVQNQQDLHAFLVCFTR